MACGILVPVFARAIGECKFREGFMPVAGFQDSLGFDECPCRIRYVFKRKFIFPYVLLIDQKIFVHVFSVMFMETLGSKQSGSRLEIRVIYQRYIHE